MVVVWGRKSKGKQAEMAGGCHQYLYVRQAASSAAYPSVYSQGWSSPGVLGDGGGGCESDGDCDASAGQVVEAPILEASDS